MLTPAWRRTMKIFFPYMITKKYLIIQHAKLYIFHIAKYLTTFEKCLVIISVSLIIFEQSDIFLI